MKHYIIVHIFVFLFLNACYPVASNKIELKPKTETSLNQEEAPNQEASYKEEDINKKTKNTLLNDLTNLIEKANTHKEKYMKMEEPSNQYEMLVFKLMRWGPEPRENVSSNTERSIKFRKKLILF
ncbi:hypothetical protein QIA19_04940 (plasmid) [Borreliella finlandensis]|uniref:hypothetical protein n=1 Tax=Borreliella finlandensis TaxID=498741 RepID=UPI003AEFAB72